MDNKHRCALQDWVWLELTIMQQSVLMAAIRGPDGLPKDHVSKLLLRWYRRCILISAFDKQPIMNPVYPQGGSFTGPSLPRVSSETERPRIFHYNVGLADSFDHKMVDGMNELVRYYLSCCDEVPHHFHLHFMHAAEILGMKHPVIPIRNWWYTTYAAICNDMHVRPELTEQMEKRLGDRESDWRAAEEVTAKAPEPDPPIKAKIDICAVCDKPAPHPIQVLTCDCYGGCWGDHSKNWPSVPADEEKKVLEVLRMLLPRGAYVYIETTGSGHGHYKIEPHYFALMKAGLVFDVASK